MIEELKCKWCLQGKDAPRHDFNSNASAPHEFDPIVAPVCGDCGIFPVVARGLCDQCIARVRRLVTGE